MSTTDGKRKNPNNEYLKPKEAAAYIDLRDRIKNLKNKEGVKFGKDVKDQNGNTIDFKVSSYTTLFETPAKIKAKPIPKEIGI